MTPARKRNLLRAPIVLLVTAPIRLLFYALVVAGEWSDRVLDRLNWLPLFERET